MILTRLVHLIIWVQLPILKIGRKLTLMSSIRKETVHKREHFRRIVQKKELKVQMDPKGLQEEEMER